MAGSLNKVMLIGNLGKDPEIRRLNNGNQVASFSMATSESWKDKNSGERKEKTDWHNVVIYNENLAKIVEQYCKKGSKVYVEGKLQTRQWEDNAGVKHYMTEVLLQNFDGKLVLLSGTKESGGRGEEDGEAKPADRGDYAAASGSSSAKTRSADLDDEIPFVSPPFLGPYGWWDRHD